MREVVRGKVMRRKYRMDKQRQLKGRAGDHEIVSAGRPAEPTDSGRQVKDEYSSDLTRAHVCLRIYSNLLSSSLILTNNLRLVQFWNFACHFKVEIYPSRLDRHTLLPKTKNPSRGWPSLRDSSLT